MKYIALTILSLFLISCTPTPGRALSQRFTLGCADHGGIAEVKHLGNHVFVAYCSDGKKKVEGFQR